MGHPLVDPTKGKLGLAAPSDPKGVAPFFPTFLLLKPAVFSHEATIHAACSRTNAGLEVPTMAACMSSVLPA